MKTSHKWLKAFLAPGVKKFGLVFIVPKLGKFPLFDNFLDLANFWGLANFWLFNFPDFLVCSILLSSNLSIFPLPLLLPKADLLLLFLLRTGFSGDPVIFNIKVSGAAILLKS